MRDRSLAWLAMGLLVTVTGGCNFFESTCDELLDPSCLGRDVTGKGIGAACERTVQCDAYLQCMDGTCQVEAITAKGGDCRRTAECLEGLYCSHKRTCDRAGDGALGDDCESTADCEAGLLCGLGEIPLKLQCVAGGELDKGEECASSAQCTPGLTCFALEGPPTCRSNLPALDQEIPPIPFWTPDACPADVDSPVAYFELPGGDAEGDFYRLPFPNDIRRSGGRIDLSAHPHPPAEAGLPIIERFIDATDGEVRGFSTNPVIYFRFSDDYTFDDVSGDTAMIIDITPESPEYNEETSLQWHAASSNYICDNWLAVRRPVGRPLRPSTTYAAILTTGISRKGGGSFSRSEDLDLMLADSAPSGSGARAAWDAYAPMRAWAADTNTPLSSILNVAVFTTQDPTELVAKMRGAVHASDLPTVSDLTVCGAGVTSPCEVASEGDEAPRGACNNTGRDFVEVHGRISLPNFQVGDAPYLQPQDVDGQTSGDISQSGGGEPRVVGRNDVCFSLAIPRDSMPTEGWPVLVYAHGTGGSFAGHLGRSGWAEEAAGFAQPAATLSIDLPQHGARRGDSDEDPELLFFNVMNPHAARGNVLQGSADLMALVRWAAEGGLSEGASPTGDAVRFDSTRMAILGHSQGATHASIMLPFEPLLAAGMLSGVGGHLTTSMLTKTEPVPIADAVGALLLDLDGSELASGAHNPALALVQTFYDAADPINYAPLLVRSPHALAPTGHHVFMSYGVDDHYTPEETQEAYVRAGRIPHVGPVLRELPVETIDAPAAGNVEVGGVTRTFGVHQYTPKAASNGDAVDGHFVAVRSDQDGFPDVARFLGQVFAGETPAIGNAED